ncbi:hypothetical protein BDW72DRAFT_187850 [Aspergillus terricola var. indicus]
MTSTQYLSWFCHLSPAAVRALGSVPTKCSNLVIDKDTEPLGSIVMVPRPARGRKQGFVVGTNALHGHTAELRLSTHDYGLKCLLERGFGSKFCGLIGIALKPMVYTVFNEPVRSSMMWWKWVVEDVKLSCAKLSAP